MTHDLYEDFADRYDLFFSRFGEHDPAVVEFFRQDFKVWSIDYPQMLLRDDQERLLKASGFGPVDFYGTYRFDPYDEESSERLIAVARK